MKKFNIVFLYLVCYWVLFIVTCKPSSTGRQKRNIGSPGSISINKRKQIGQGNGLTSGIVKTQVLPCAEGTLIAAPAELSKDEQIERDRVYDQLKQSVIRYRAQIVNEIGKFQANIDEINKKIKKNGGKTVIDDKGTELEALSMPRFEEVSVKFLSPALVQNIYSSLGHDVKVINHLGRIISSLNLSETPQAKDTKSKGPQAQLLDISYNILFALSSITNLAIQVTNEYLDGPRLTDLARSKSIQNLVELNNHVDEFMQTRAQFIEKIKNEILRVKIRAGHAEGMLEVLQKIMGPETDIVLAFEFTKQKAAIIQCSVNNLLSVL
ncbi:hypothetical protein bhYOR_001137 (plasmid) [Borrelia nietonii YOR]|uniref:Antigen P35 n=2 Tax=Borrelia TaxID=138 RepID=W5T5E5_BORHE|nr:MULTISPECIES: hypothetical protein [Borrelia]AHH14560.1 hypothetical protein BHW_0023400 [Borrelia hermsii MTW]UPA09830.1 hypothetical protein bhYOR_001137 [Borrelia nietonii YOR]